MDNTQITNCVVQCRVSSTKQSGQGESLESQERTIRQFITNRGWHIVPDDKVWSTAISGRKTDREDFEEILAYIKAHPGLVQYYIFRSIDRATRAGGEEYSRMKRVLDQEGVQMLDTFGVIQPTQNTLAEYGMSYDWSKFSPSEITEGVLAATAKQEVTTILTRLIGQEINLTRQGYKTRGATDGFALAKIHDSAGKKKPIQAPDPKRAKFYIAMFDLRIRGLSDVEIVDRVNAMGYRSRMQNRRDKRGRIIGTRGGRKLSLKQLQRVIQKTIYAGILCEKWTHYKGVRAQYPGLVSIETFNRANRGKIAIKEYKDGSVEVVHNISTKTGQRRNRNNPLVPDKFILCSICRKPFLASSPRGKSGKQFPTYHCGRNHEYFGVSKSEFEDSIESFITSLSFRPGLLHALEATFLKKYQERSEEITTTATLIEKNIETLKNEQITKINASVTTQSPVIREKLEKDVEELEIRIKDAEREQLRIKITEKDIQEFVGQAKDIVEHPKEILLAPANMVLQKDLFELVFEEVPTYGEIVSGTPKMSLVFQFSGGFEDTQSQLVALRGIDPRFPG